jgi:ParB-like chromosome segregation protein Spo0J
MIEERNARFFNLSENLQRKDLNIMQEARALLPLKILGVTEYELAEKIGMSRGWVQVRFMLLALPGEIQDEVTSGYIGQTDIRELFSIFRAAGKDAAFTATRKLKDAKLLGKKKNTVDIKIKRYNAKRVRQRPEVLKMMEHMQETIGNGLHTRALAWMAGEISDIDLYLDIKVFAKEHGKEYIIPPEGVIVSTTK